MRTVPLEMTEAWLSPDKTGERRPTARATIQYVSTAAYPYDEHTDIRNVRGTFNTVIFSQPAEVIEIPELDSITWNRGVTQDVAECTLKIKGSALTPIGQVGDNQGLYDDPGALVPNRGVLFDNDRWGFIANGWEQVFVPDRMVRTYEGYGSDNTVYPAQDSHLKQSGTWLIDEVTVAADGTIELKMRDVGRLLLDQISSLGRPVPWNHYPMTWETRHTEQKPTFIAHHGDWYRPHGSVGSDGPAFVGHSIATSDGSLFVAANGVWAGNAPVNVLNSEPNRVWFSTGNSQRLPDGPKNWLQFNLTNDNTAIAGVKVLPIRGAICYISLYSSKLGKWLGTKKIPNNSPTEGIDNGSRIHYVNSFQVDADTMTEHILGSVRKHIKTVRLTFRPGGEFGSDAFHTWRSGVREVWLYTGPPSTLSVTKGTKTINVGNVDDYTDAVKWILGWAGFYWPPHSTQGDYQYVDASTKEYISYVSGDSAIPAGRIWGDFMNAGTGPAVELTADLFDKQPLMDAIGYIRDVLGFVCWVDETGGFVWRMPNIWSPGNYLSADDLDPRSSSTTSTVLSLTDEDVLLSYSTTRSSRNLREQIFVANTDGRFATMAGGYAQDLGVDFHRVAGYMDQHFASQTEVETMADLIATRQKFSYLVGRAVIPGYPGIQVDDQVRIFDRTTNETFYHYVETISSSLDMTTGVWTYDLGTHWLGEQAGASWVIDTSPTGISSELRIYLLQLGLL